MAWVPKLKPMQADVRRCGGGGGGACAQEERAHLEPCALPLLARVEAEPSLPGVLGGSGMTRA